MASGSPVKVFTFTSPRMPCAPMITPSRSVLGGTVSAMRQARRSAGSGFVGGRRRRGSSFGSGLGGFLGGLDALLRLGLRLGLFRVVAVGPGHQAGLGENAGAAVGRLPSG